MISRLHFSCLILVLKASTNLDLKHTVVETVFPDQRQGLLPDDLVEQFLHTTEKVEFPVSENVLDVHYRAKFHVNFLKFALYVVFPTHFFRCKSVGNLTFTAVSGWLEV